jgi:hypothetical protein
MREVGDGAPLGDRWNNNHRDQAQQEPSVAVALHVSAIRWDS